MVNGCRARTTLDCVGPCAPRSRTLKCARLRCSRPPCQPRPAATNAVALYPAISVLRQLPVQRARVTVTQREAQPAGEIPVAAAHGGSAVDDLRRDGLAVGGIPERDPRSAGQRPIRDTNERLRHRIATGRPLPVEAGAVPGDVAVEVPL